MKQARSRVAKRYNVDCKSRKYQVGDTLLCRMRMASSKANNISAKFLLKWSKPVVIAKIVWPDMVVLANLKTGPM